MANEADRAPPTSRPYTGCSDRVELPGDVVGDSPKIADFGLPDECVGPPLVPPIQQVDVLTTIEGRRNVRQLRGPDDQGQRTDRLVVGRIDELRRRAAFGHDQLGAAETEPPGLQIRQSHLLGQALTDLLQRLAGVSRSRHVQPRVVARVDEELEVAGGVAEPGAVSGGCLNRWPLAGRAIGEKLGDAQIDRTPADDETEQRSGDPPCDPPAVGHYRWRARASAERDNLGT